MSITDGAVATITREAVPVSDIKRKTYIVENESGLFKSGTHYPKGSEVDLVETAAKNFLALGDIKEKEVSDEA